jgi:hypothetical protein
MQISNPLWKAVGRLLKKLKLELPHDPAILLLGIYPKEYKSGYNKDTCTPIFIAALFTIAKLWKLPDAQQLMNGLRKCDTHTHTHTHTHMIEYYLAIKKNEISSICHR